MDCSARKKAIQEAKTYAEAEPLLGGLGPSAMMAARLSFQIRETQPQLANEFMATVIREIDGLKEYEGGQSEQASNRADPLPREDQVTPDGERPDTGATNTENQMREDLMGMLHPEIASGLMPQSMPGMTLPQQVKQMQYTAERILKPLVKEVEGLRAENKALREAVKALDKKVTETTNSKQSVPLDVTNRNIRETAPETPLLKRPVEDARLAISELDKAMSSGKIPASI